MSKIRMLHLSDIHFGQEKEGNYAIQPDIRDGVVRDCEIMKAQLGAATGILVTGDIAFSGKQEQYDAAGPWLDSICDKVSCERRGVHIIPGNHDVDRSKIDYGVDLLHEAVRTSAPDGVDHELYKIVGDKNMKLPTSELPRVS